MPIRSDVVKHFGRKHVDRPAYKYQTDPEMEAMIKKVDAKKKEKKPLEPQEYMGGQPWWKEKIKEEKMNEMPKNPHPKYSDKYFEWNKQNRTGFYNPHKPYSKKWFKRSEELARFKVNKAWGHDKKEVKEENLNEVDSILDRASYAWKRIRAGGKVDWKTGAPRTDADERAWNEYEKKHDWGIYGDSKREQNQGKRYERQMGLHLKKNEETMTEEKKLVGSYTPKNPDFAGDKWERWDYGTHHSMVMTQKGGESTKNEWGGYSGPIHVGTPKYIGKRWEGLKSHYESKNSDGSYRVRKAIK